MTLGQSQYNLGWVTYNQVIVENIEPSGSGKPESVGRNWSGDAAVHYSFVEEMITRVLSYHSKP